jgi:hypothetical protein
MMATIIGLPSDDLPASTIFTCGDEAVSALTYSVICGHLTSFLSAPIRNSKYCSGDLGA